MDLMDLGHLSPSHWVDTSPVVQMQPGSQKQHIGQQQEQQQQEQQQEPQQHQQQQQQQQQQEQQEQQHQHQQKQQQKQATRTTYRARKKLRESCNNCALSKVRCSKEQPVCARCEDREMECHYSPTRRTGKRRQWSNNSQSGPAVGNNQAQTNTSRDNLVGSGGVVGVSEEGRVVTSSKAASTANLVLKDFPPGSDYQGYFFYQGGLILGPDGLHIMTEDLVDPRSPEGSLKNVSSPQQLNRFADPHMPLPLLQGVDGTGKPQTCMGVRGEFPYQMPGNTLFSESMDPNLFGDPTHEMGSSAAGIGFTMDASGDVTMSGSYDDQDLRLGILGHDTPPFCTNFACLPNDGGGEIGGEEQVDGEVGGACHDHDTGMAPSGEGFIMGGGDTFPLHRPQQCIRQALEILQNLHTPSANCTFVPPSTTATTTTRNPATSPSCCSSCSSPRSSTPKFHSLHPISSPSIGSPASSTSTTTPASAASATTRNISDVLAANREVVSVVDRMLDCPCSLNMQLALLLTTIASKIISWYSVAAQLPADEMAMHTGGSRCSNNIHNHHNHMPNCNSNSCNGGGSSSNSRPGGTVLGYGPNSPQTMPTLPSADSDSTGTMSGTSLDGSISSVMLSTNGNYKAKMRAQMVLAELHLVLRLVEKLVARFRGIQLSEEGGPSVSGLCVNEEAGAMPGLTPSLSPGANSSNNNNSKRKDNSTSVMPPPPIFVEMERFLRDHLRILARQATDLLRSS